MEGGCVISVFMCVEWDVYIIQNSIKITIKTFGFWAEASI